MNKRIRRYQEHYCLGAIHMLKRLQEDYLITSKDYRKSAENRIYDNAVLTLVVQSNEKVSDFIEGHEIGFRNHKYNSHGRLLEVEAYFI